MTTTARKVKPLSAKERADLTKIEKKIATGIGTFIVTGKLLIKVRDRRLYREDYDTFEEYGKSRWGISRPRLYQLMDAAEIVSDVEEMSTESRQRPLNEAQVRPLKAVPPDARATVLEEATKEAKPTGEVVSIYAKAFNGLPPEKQKEVLEGRREELKKEVERQKSSPAAMEGKIAKAVRALRKLARALKELPIDVTRHTEAIGAALGKLGGKVNLEDDLEDD